MTVVWSRSLTADNNNWSGACIRTKNVSLSGGGDQIRVRFVASGSQALSVAHVGVAKVGSATWPNTQVAPVELKFSGSNGFSISAGSTITSDWLTFSFTSSDTIVVSIGFIVGTTGIKIDGGGSGNDAAWKNSAASDALVATVSGYTNNGFTRCVDQIEGQFTAVTYNQTVNATSTTSVSPRKSARKSVAVTASSAVAISKFRIVAQAIAATCSASVALSKGVGKLVAATCAGAISQARAMTRTIAVSSTSMVQVQPFKTILQSIAAACGTSVSIFKTVGKIASASCSTLVDMVRHFWTQRPRENEGWNQSSNSQATWIEQPKSSEPWGEASVQARTWTERPKPSPAWIRKIPD